LPTTEAKRAAYAQIVGEDGFRLLDALDAPEVPQAARGLPIIAVLRRTWQRHYERTPGEIGADGTPLTPRMPFKASGTLSPAAEGIESPYDADARNRHKRAPQWTGYLVQVSKTCEPTAPHLLTHVQTTPATVHEAQSTESIQQALAAKGLPPSEHLVDAAYIDAALLVTSREQHGITLPGPTRPNISGQAQAKGGYTVEHFAVAWARQQV
jgi:transposase